MLRNGARNGHQRAGSTRGALGEMFGRQQSLDKIHIYGVLHHVRGRQRRLHMLRKTGDETRATPISDLKVRYLMHSATARPRPKATRSPTWRRRPRRLLQKRSGPNMGLTG